MKVTIKSAEEIEKMRRAGKILAAVHQNLAREIKPGMSTLDIDRLGEEMIRGYGCIPSFKNYCGYPASICVSVNEEVVHGIPTDERIIKEGDIVSLDAGVIYEGYHSDAARTVAVGEVSEEAKLLIERTRQSFIEGMKKAVAGNHLYDISAAIGDYANQFGYGVVEDLCGHGIGSHLHEEPEIPNFRQSRFRRGIKLKPGMTLAVEPMINVGTKDVLWMDDEWTVVTEDKSLSAHYENTILITDGKPEILSLTEEEKKAGFLNLFYDRVLGNILLTKVDLDAARYLAAGSNGDTTLEGAVYDLYAADTIEHPDGVSGVVDYSKITDANGQPIWHTTVLTNGGWASTA